MVFVHFLWDFVPKNTFHKTDCARIKICIAITVMLFQIILVKLFFELNIHQNNYGFYSLSNKTPYFVRKIFFTKWTAQNYIFYSHYGVSNFNKVVF